MINHVRRYKKPGFYKFTGWPNKRSCLSEWKCPEVVVRRCSVKKLFLNISENFQKTPAVKSLFIRVTDLRGFDLNSAKFLTISTGKTRIGGWLLLTFLMCLHNQLALSWRRPLSYRNQSIDFLYDNGLRHERVKFYYTLYYTYEECRCLENVIHQMDSESEWLLLPASFTTKFGLVLL